MDLDADDGLVALERAAVVMIGDPRGRVVAPCAVVSHSAAAPDAGTAWSPSDTAIGRRAAPEPRPERVVRALS